MDEFELPFFLENHSFLENMQRMINNAPSDIDFSEGSDLYNLLAPTAYEIAQIAQFLFPELIKCIFPQFCQDYDRIADYHAQSHGMSRKQAQKATGEISVNGIAGLFIPQGTIFSTISLNKEPVVEFRTTEEANINENGTINIGIEAIEGGASGNVASGTIVTMDNIINGVASMINNQATSGGIDEESTQALLNRIIEYEQSRNISFCGSPSDYKRWALEVDGVGGAIVIPAQDDTGLVTIVLTDLNGEHASLELRQSVYNHIMGSTLENRLAPCNALLSVIAPLSLSIYILADVKIQGSTLSDIKAQFLLSIKEYLHLAQEEGEIKISKIGSLLSQTSGIVDYANLFIGLNNFSLDTINIFIPETTLPLVILENINLNEV